MFFMLKAWGKGDHWLIFLVNSRSIAPLYNRSDLFFLFVDRYKSFDGGDGGVHIYEFPPAVFEVKVLLCFTVFLTWFWKVFVVSVATERLKL